MGGFALATAAAAPSAEPRFVKSICSIIFPDEMPRAECFRRVKDAGFDAIELVPHGEIALDADPDGIKRVGDAARKAGVAIASYWISGPLANNPLNSDDPDARARGVATIVKSVEVATWLGCGALLLVPGRLGNGARFQYGYEVTWQRFTEGLKLAIPAAERAGVLLTPENVWNKFLVSPLEMRAFVDQFHSPWLQAHFDVGNVMQYGFPEDWILTLGSRIKRVHLKDYKLSARAEQGRFVPLLEGDVNWKAVMAALGKVGYRGTLSPEISLDPRDPDQLRNVSRALDRILELA
jgi:hexulose-6-phosphate isomerase